MSFSLLLIIVLPSPSLLMFFLLILSSTLPSRFVSPQTGSSSRYMGQQNSPVPSPYTPQSPATGYIQPYPHQQPPNYNQHQQIQQGESGICWMFICMHDETEVLAEMWIGASSLCFLCVFARVRDVHDLFDSLNDINTISDLHVRLASSIDESSTYGYFALASCHHPLFRRKQSF